MSLARFAENLFRRPLGHPQPDSLPCGGGLGRGHRQQPLSKHCLKNASSALSLTLSHGRGNKSQHHQHFQTASVKKTYL